MTRVTLLYSNTFSFFLRFIVYFSSLWLGSDEWNTSRSILLLQNLTIISEDQSRDFTLTSKGTTYIYDDVLFQPTNIPFGCGTLTLFVRVPLLLSILVDWSSSSSTSCIWPFCELTTKPLSDLSLTPDDETLTLWGKPDIMTPRNGEIPEIEVFSVTR